VDGDIPSRFANVIFVSFSPFDPFVLVSEKIGEPSSLTPTSEYIGLHTRFPNIRIKTLHELAKDFAESIQKCLETDANRDLWFSALETLSTDLIFKSETIVALADRSSDRDLETLELFAIDLFHRLSSGHMLVLLVITQLVALVEERTLVLIDEPETHLHPPFLSSYLRAISNLLIYRNGAAIIATHSPVVLQEVPKECVTLIRRVGEIVNFDKPEFETYGENVGTLTREIFGLEVTESGFYKNIRDAVKKTPDYNRVVAQRFHNELGSEAKALIRVLIANMLEEDDAQEPSQNDAEDQ